MAAVGIETKQPESAAPEEVCAAKGASKQGEGLRQYYLQHIHELQLQVRQKTHNLNRLEAQRNELNSRGPLFISTLTLIWSFLDFFLLTIPCSLGFCFSISCYTINELFVWFLIVELVSDFFEFWKILTVRMLKEELQLLQEPGSYVGEVVKVMGKNKVLVKVSWCFTLSS